MIFDLHRHGTNEHGKFILCLAYDLVSLGWDVRTTPVEYRMFELGTCEPDLIAMRRDKSVNGARRREIRRIVAVEVDDKLTAAKVKHKVTSLDRPFINHVYLLTFTPYRGRTTIRTTHTDYQIFLVRDHLTFAGVRKTAEMIV